MSNFSTPLKGAEGEIVVRINVKDIPTGRTLDQGIWETYIVGKLREAGVPLTPFGGDVIRGTLWKRDDPEDFGSTIYTWMP